MGGGLEGRIRGEPCFMKCEGGHEGGGYECYVVGSCERVGGGKVGGINEGAGIE